jgi:hypothetical protein
MCCISFGHPGAKSSLRALTEPANRVPRRGQGNVSEERARKANLQILLLNHPRNHRLGLHAIQARVTSELELRRRGVHVLAQIPNPADFFLVDRDFNALPAFLHIFRCPCRSLVRNVVDPAESEIPVRGEHKILLLARLASHFGKWPGAQVLQPAPPMKGKQMPPGAAAHAGGIPILRSPPQALPIAGQSHLHRSAQKPSASGHTHREPLRQSRQARPQSLLASSPQRKYILAALLTPEFT